MLEGIVSLLLQVSDEEGTPGVERLNAFDSRQAQCLIHSHSVEKFTDVLQSGEMGCQEMNIVVIAVNNVIIVTFPRQLGSNPPTHT